MAEKKLLVTIKPVPASRPAFLFSEVLPSLDTQLPMHELIRSISSHLPAMGLVAKKTGDDFEISRFTPVQSYFLNHEENERQEAFFDAGLIPDLLAQSLARYITKKTG